MGPLLRESEYVELIAGRRKTLDRLAQGIGDGAAPTLGDLHDEHPARAPLLGHGLSAGAVAGSRGGGVNAALRRRAPGRGAADPAADGWALVSTRAAGVCGTELHFLDGMIPPPTTPFQLGHEAAGIVLEAPPARAVAAGDRVAVYNMVGCGRCPRGASRESLCTDPVGQLGFSLPGGFADVVRAPAENRIPSRTPSPSRRPRSSPAAGCRSSTPRGSPASRSATVVVNGVGGVGLMAIQVANAAGARAIAIADSEEKATAAREVGAAETIVLAGGQGYDELPGKIRDLTGGAGADHYVELVGTSQTMLSGSARSGAAASSSSSATPTSISTCIRSS